VDWIYDYLIYNRLTVSLKGDDNMIEPRKFRIIYKLVNPNNFEDLQYVQPQRSNNIFLPALTPSEESR